MLGPTAWCACTPIVIRVFVLEGIRVVGLTLLGGFVVCVQDRDLAERKVQCYQDIEKYEV